MQTEFNENSKEPAKHKEEEPYVPFDGFVNVNDIIKKRRQLRNAEFNVADEIWDADLNLQPKKNPEEGSSEDK